MGRGFEWTIKKDNQIKTFKTINKMVDFLKVKRPRVVREIYHRQNPNINGWNISKTKKIYKKPMNKTILMANIIKECKKICNDNPWEYPELEKLIDELEKRSKGNQNE